jgi:hypothetical protein
MAFDQVSLFLYPPRWQRHSAPDELLKDYSGEPVRLVSAIPAEQSEGWPVQIGSLCRWFEAHSFGCVVCSAKYARFHSATIESALGCRPEIDASASAEEGEVTSLYCRFLLNRDAPLRLERWEAFIQELCAAFELRISVSDTESVGPEKFLSVVRGTAAWRFFAEQFGWLTATE